MSEKEYIVTLTTDADPSSFQAEMTNSTGDSSIPSRTVDVANARLGSQRNTHYALTDAEATNLKNDSRVLDVAIPPDQDDNLEIASKTPQETFYLGGHINMSCNKQITQSDINAVQKKIDSTDISQCWGMEIYSVMEHNRRFSTFKIFYNNYIEFINHKLYQPGGSKYYETMEHFNNSLEQV